MPLRHIASSLHLPLFLEETFLHTLIYKDKRKMILFVNSSHGWPPIKTKHSQITYTTPYLNLRGATCEKQLLPRSARRKTSQTAVRHFGSTEKICGLLCTLLCCQYNLNHCSRTPPVSVDKKTPKRSHPSHAVPHLNLRGSTCANKLLLRSVRRKAMMNRPSAILDL